MQKVIITQHNATGMPERRKLLYGHQSFIIWFTAAVHAIIDDPKGELQQDTEEIGEGGRSVNNCMLFGGGIIYYIKRKGVRTTSINRVNYRTLLSTLLAFSSVVTPFRCALN